MAGGFIWKRNNRAVVDIKWLTCIAILSMSVDYYINCAIVVTLCVFVVVELPKESSDNSNRRETWNESKD